MKSLSSADKTRLVVLLAAVVLWTPLLKDWVGSSRAYASGVDSNGAIAVDPQATTPMYPACFGGYSDAGLTEQIVFTAGTSLWIACGLNGGSVPTGDFWFSTSADGGPGPWPGYGDGGPGVLWPDGGHTNLTATAFPCYSGQVLRMSVPGISTTKAQVTMNVLLNQTLSGDLQLCVAPSAP
jgi:hypothetical protein